MVEDANSDEDAEPELPIQPFKFYCTSKATFKIVWNNWGWFTILGGFVYFYHLCFTIAGVNNYSDITRKALCGDAKNADDASGIMDTAIVMVTVYHMIEWLRWLVWCTTATVGVDLIPLFYGVSLFNIPFGIISMLVAIGSRFSGSASDCAAEMQVERARYLLL
jgi:hypothetical protein